jgi:hypothetical protein
MSRSRQGQRFFRRVGDEQLFPGNAKALAAMLRIDLRCMRFRV